MTQPLRNTDNSGEDFESFFEQALCGFVIADSQGIILRTNIKLTEWTGLTADELKGRKFSTLLTTGGKIYYETHLWPLLRMQGFFDEVVVELIAAGNTKLRVLVNAAEHRDKEGKPFLIRYVIVKASDRLLYEQNLQQAKANTEKELIKQQEMLMLREQLIAVLGHDLRNPLSAVTMAASLLEISRANTTDAPMVATLKRSSARMTELISNIMDFAKTRLGQGIVPDRKDIILEPVLQQVINEMKLIYPHREIISVFDIMEPVNCDANRIAQLASNLVANAITHGTSDKPVFIHATHRNGVFELSVSNSGDAIPERLHDQLFTPFTREVSRPSQHGLGLGLYICSEIAKAHKAALTFSSTTAETRFTFRMEA